MFCVLLKYSMATASFALDKEKINRLPTLLCSLQRYIYCPNITIIWDGRNWMFAVLLRSTLCFVYKVYIVIGFSSPKRDWTVAVVQNMQYSKFTCLSTVIYIFNTYRVVLNFSRGGGGGGGCYLHALK
jgi:hypothetical protein